MRDIVSDGRRVVVRLATWLARQDHAVDNARRASTEVSRRRVERDEVSIYLDGMRGPSKEQWPGASAEGG